MTDRKKENAPAWTVALALWAVGGGCVVPAETEAGADKLGCWGESCITECGVAQLEHFSRANLSATAKAGTQATTIEGFAEVLGDPSQPRRYCAAGDARKTRGLDRSHPNVTFEGSVPFGWQLWMYPPHEWEDDGDGDSDIAGSVRMQEGCGLMPPPRGCGFYKALAAEVRSTEVVLSRVYQYDNFEALGQGAVMRASALVRLEGSSVSDGWLAFGVRPLATPTDGGVDDPRHPDIHWLQITPGTLGQNAVQVVETDPGHIYSDDGGTKWYRLNLGQLFEFPAHPAIAVYVKIGTRPGAPAPTIARIDSIDLEVTDPSTFGGHPPPMDWCDPGYEDDDLDTASAPDFEGVIRAGDERGGTLCTGYGDRPDDIDTYRVEGPGIRTVSLHFSHMAGDLDMEAVDLAGHPLDYSWGVTDHEIVEAPAPFLVRVHGYQHAGNQFVIRVR